MDRFWTTSVFAGYNGAKEHERGKVAKLCVLLFLWFWARVSGGPILTPVGFISELRAVLVKNRRLVCPLLAPGGAGKK